MDNLLLRWCLGIQDTTRLDSFKQESELHDLIWLAKLSIASFQRWFPDARFIHIIRDGRAVAYSWAIKEYNTMKEHMDVYKGRGYYYPFNELIKLTAKSWVKNFEVVEEHKRKCNLNDRGIFIEFTYEDFCDNPEKYVSSICRLLNITRERLGIDDLSYIKSMNFKWKKNLENDIIEEINKIALPAMRKLK